MTTTELAASGRVADYLRTAILDGEIGPGQRIRQEDVSWWAGSFLNAAYAEALSESPRRVTAAGMRSFS